LSNLPPIEKLPLYELTDYTFGDHILMGQHFVAFHVPWCSHCRYLEPIWNDLAAAFSHDVTVTIARVRAGLNLIVDILFALSL